MQVGGKACKHRDVKTIEDEAHFVDGELREARNFGGTLDCVVYEISGDLSFASNFKRIVSENRLRVSCDFFSR